jgi:hypothetical protein
MGGIAGRVDRIEKRFGLVDPAVLDPGSDPNQHLAAFQSRHEIVSPAKTP